MAITPESSETFAREVDENLRRDQLQRAARTYAKWAVFGVFVLLSAIAAFLFWRDQRAKEAATDSVTMSAVIENIGNGNIAPVAKQLDGLEASRSDAIAVSARLTRAALALQDGDRPRALRIYQAVAADGAVDQPWRDLALVRQTALEYDTLAPQAVIDRLQPLALAGNAWFGSAGEMTALALLKARRRSEAGRMFAAIARDASVPESIRERARQMAGTLGIDVTLPTPTPGASAS